MSICEGYDMWLDEFSCPCLVTFNDIDGKKIAHCLMNVFKQIKQGKGHLPDECKKANRLKELLLED